MGQNRARPGGGLDQEGSQNRARPGGRVHSRFVRARTDWGPDQGQGRTSARARGWGQTMARGRARPRATGFARTRWGARPDGGPEQGQGQAHGPGHRPLPQTSAATPCH